MAKKKVDIIDNYGGIAQSKKIGQNGSFRFATNLDIYSDPNDLRLNITGSKVSGTTVVGLVKWIEDGTPYNSKRYFYDNAGNIYEEDASGTWSLLRTVSSSHGQGLAIHNDYLYYTQDSQIGRYGPLSATPSFTDDWQTGLNDTSESGFAPIIVLNDRMIVGHGNGVSSWDGAVWTASVLVLPQELNVRSFTLADQYVVVGAWRGTAVTDSEDGYIYTYDGLSDTFNEAFPTNGGLNAMQYYRNKLVSIHGHQGHIYTDSSPFNKVHQIPGVGRQEYLEVYPGAMTTWKELVTFGVSHTNAANVRSGIYTYGANSTLFPEALNFAITISTGEDDSSIQIGAVKGIGNDLYIGWYDGTDYGVDKIDENSAYALSGTYESLIFDGAIPGEEKLIEVVKVSHLPLASDESVVISYKIDRAAAWTTGTTNTTGGTTETKYYHNARQKEFEWQTKITGDGTSSPTIVQQTLVYDDLKEEKAD